MTKNPNLLLLIVDSKSIQNADTAEVKGYDGGKKAGVKLHIGVDIIGTRLLCLVLSFRQTQVYQRSAGLSIRW